MSPAGRGLGAPGVYRDGRRAAPSFRPVRLDIAGFVGVAPRGPVDEPVAVDRWADYQRYFGGLEGPGLLPYAVRAFFAQGGVRAHVLRVAPLPRAPHPAAEEARALHRTTLARADAPGADPGRGTPCAIGLRARDEGSWGGRLSVRWEFTGSGPFEAAANGRELALPEGRTPPAGSVLRVRGSWLPASGSFFRVLELAERQDEYGARGRVAVLDRPPGGGAPASGGTRPRTVEAEVVTATVTVADGDPAHPRLERFAELGLGPAHPRYAAAVLAAESLLVAPDGPWPGALLPPDGYLGSALSRPVRPGTDRYGSIGSDSFQGAVPAELLPVDGFEGAEEAGPGQVVGVDRMALVTEVALLCVPDLLWQYGESVPTTETPPREPGGSFSPCPPPPAPMTLHPARPRALLLDAGAQLPEILRRQQRLVALAERQRRFVALLDVPPGLPVRAVARWRAAFDSSYAAAYHPWLGVVAPEDPERRAVYVPPSGFAAGIIAERERSLGLPWGPANALAADAVTAAQRLGEADCDELHLLGIDVFRAERDGYRLASARTLSRDPDHRQLSVRRLMTMLRLVLDRQARGLAFEPHTPQLQGALRAAVVQLLRGLYRGGAFAGETEDEAFFVRCDEHLNPGWSQGLGRLVAEIGVAPARPLEYLVLRIAQDADGSVAVT
ncbi:phage tail sheath subtilisin-like domain-containing protein [Streptomyces flavotricini]|uniref:Phage tail sheath subtilisin-like domain-containing protein n=1 Tax=Streptomyces flavotricini TaxID=66888 RepID=A0ABS8E1Q7_9ACTN|nr:phage tail sheath subtilisin-like domain-containing protein [Streptomyces flavotricini]MCC0095076.1 phage tail sheath subtilisin-like domain-containing protein [Streptomyces flavotricini]